MDFQKDFDELLDEILTDYKNQFPEADTSQGSLIYIKSACMTSALWGLYKYQEYISKQIFPDTADSENLDHHAWVRGLTRNPEESDSDLLTRLLDYIRRPPAGGNQYDYVKWAEEIANVKSAYCYPLAQGLGTVDVVIVADKDATGSEVPSSYPAVTGATTGVQTGKLTDTTAGFITSGVKVGDKAKNNTLMTETTVTAIDNETTLTVGSDIFTATGQSYTLTSGSEVPNSYAALIGTTTSVQSQKLINSAAGFSTSGVMPGDTVKNESSGSETTVTAVDNETTLTIDSDIFTSAGQRYSLVSLVSRVKAHVDDVRPVAASVVRVLAPSILSQNVTMTVTGSDADKTQLRSDIIAYLDNFEPEQKLYVAQLTALAIERGADNVTVTTPATDVTPSTYQMIRSGVITIN